MPGRIGAAVSAAVGIGGVVLLLLGLLLFFTPGSLVNAIVVILAGLALMGIAYYLWR